MLMQEHSGPGKYPNAKSKIQIQETTNAKRAVRAQGLGSAFNELAEAKGEKALHKKMAAHR